MLQRRFDESLFELLHLWIPPSQEPPRWKRAHVVCGRDVMSCSRYVFAIAEVFSGMIGLIVVEIDVDW